MQVDGASRLMVIVGDPIAQVKSPAGMTAALQAAGINAVMMPIHVAPADLADVLQAMSRIRNLDGIIATIPHKFACYALCATASTRAHALQAVNIMRRNADGGWHGDMLDGLGFVTALRQAGGEPAGQRALLLGAGGAGSAIGLALLEAGAAHLAIHDPDIARRDALIARLSALFPGHVGIGSPDPRGHQLIANATPSGMRPDDPSPVDLAGLDPSMVVGCVITAPAIPAWVAAARAVGCRASVGRDMYRAVQTLMLDFLRG